MSAVSERNDQIETFKFNPDGLDPLGYIPGVSTITGLCRMIGGIAVALFGTVNAAYQKFTGDRFYQGSNTTLLIKATYHVVRGAIEAIPVLGNIVAISFDAVTNRIPKVIIVL